MKTLALWLLMVLAISVMPLEAPEIDIPSSDKLGHSIIYAITTALIYVVMKGRGALRRMGLAKTVLIAAVLATLYGGLMEAAQSLTPTRSPSLWDGVFNSLGAALASVFLVFKERGAIRRA